LSRHFRNREPHDLERDLRDGPEPPPDLVQRIVSRTRRSRSAIPRGRAITATVLSTGLLFALGATGGLGSVSSAIKDTAGSVTKVINGSDKHRSGWVGSDRGKPAKPARDQYTHPGDGCDMKRGDSLATSNTVKKHATKKKVRKHAPKKHHPPKKKKKPVRRPPVVTPLPGVVGTTDPVTTTPVPVTTTPGPVTTAPDSGKKEPPKGKPSPPKGKPHPGKPRPCQVPTHHR
jgi:hypothetical protein